MDESLCAYCEKPGQLIPIRRMPGLYHLRCVAEAKKALEAARGPSLIKAIAKRL